MKRFFKYFFHIILTPFRGILWIIRLPSRMVIRIREFLLSEPEESSLGEVVSDSLQAPEVLMEHLQALRKHLFRMLISMVITIGLVSAFTPKIIDFLSLPIGGIDSLQAIDVTESVGVFMRVALFGGFALATPYIVFELWLFAAPGLRPRGRILGLIGIPLATILLLSGMAFAYYIMLPVALPFLLNFMGIETIPRPSSYVNFVTGLMFWIGVAFEFPLITFVLSLMKLLKPASLLKQWRLAIVIIAVLAALITPTVDPVNMALVMAPMVLLYFISIGLGYLAYPRK